MIWLVRSAIALLFPRTETMPGAEDCNLDDFLARFREETSPVMWFGVVAAAILFHVSPLFTVHWPVPAFLLPAAVADRHAHRISSTRVYVARQLIFLLKIPAGLVWGAHPDVRKRFALPPLAADPGTWRAE